MKAFLLFPALMVCLQAGCASRGWSPIDAATLKATEPTSLAVVVDETPTFGASSVNPMVAGAIVGMIGGAIREELGRKFVRDNGLVDPAIQVREGLSSALTKAFNLRVKLRILTNAETPDSDFAGADLAMRVRTVDWSVESDSSHSWALLHLRATLFDIRAQKVVAEGDCQSEVPPATTAPTNDQLLANNGAILKEQLRTVADRCRDYFRRCLLSIGDGADAGAPACPAAGHYPGERVIHSVPPRAVRNRG